MTALTKVIISCRQVTRGQVSRGQISHGPTAVRPVPLLIATGESGIAQMPDISVAAARFLWVTRAALLLLALAVRRTRTCKGPLQQVLHKKYRLNLPFHPRGAQAPQVMERKDVPIEPNLQRLSCLK